MKYIIFVLVFLIFSCSDSSSSNNQISDRSFSFNYDVEIPSTDEKKLELWLPVPKSNEVQTITNLKIDAANLSYQLLNESKHGNNYIYIHDENGTKESVKISLSFDVNRIEHKNQNYADVRPDNYLGSYQMVPTGEMFSEIISNNSLSKMDMRAVYDYVLNGMHYGKPKSVDNKYYHDPWLNADGAYGAKGVSRDEVVELYTKAKMEGTGYTFGNGNSIYACNIGVGNCTDYHSYFMSLGRTMEVPVRFHMGFPIPDNTEGTVGGYHCWADYYIEGQGWYPIDISEADKNPKKTDYFFGTICNNRVEMVVGRDLELKGYENKIVNLFIYPILELNDIESKNYTKTFSYKNI